MTVAQTLALRISEVRSRLNEISGLEGDDFTDEIRSEAKSLQAEFSDLEVKNRAAIIGEAGEAEARAAGFEDTGEGAEIRALRARVNVADYLTAAVAGHGIAGPAVELNAALECPAVGRSGGVALPLALLGKQETRAATTTAALDGGTAQRPILQRLFGSKNILEALGVRMDSVPSGMSEWPIITSGVTPAQTKETVAAPAATAAAFTTATLKPKRLTGRYEITVEMMAQVPGAEASFRQDLGAAVESKMCDLIVNGAAPSNSDPHLVEGLLTKLTAPTTAPTAAPTFASGSSLAGTSSVVDGLHADREGQVQVVIGPASYRTLASIVGSGTDRSIVEALGARSGGLMASPFIPAPVSDVQHGIVHGSGPNGGGVMRGDSVAAMWPTLELVRDIYTKAAEGQIILTWIMLWDAVVAFREAAYQQVSVFTG